MENSRSSGCCASSSMLTIHLERLPGFHSVPQRSLHFPASHISRPFAVPATSPPMSSWGWTTATTPFSPAPFSSQASPPSASPASHISHPFAVPATSPPIPSWGWTTVTTTFSPAPPPPQSAGPSAPVSSSVTAPISWRSALSGNSLADYNVAQQRFIGHPSVPPPPNYASPTIHGGPFPSHSRQPISCATSSIWPPFICHPCRMLEVCS